MRGEAGDDVLDGGSGNDTLIGGAGADKMVGGTGSDTVSYTGSNGVTLDLSDPSKSRGDAKGDSFESIEKFVGSEGSDDMRGSDKADVFHGNGGTDKLSGNDGNDHLTINAGWAYGDEGNDTLIVEGGAGKNAHLFGGEGNDTAVYTTSHKGVSISLQKGTAKGADATGDTLISIENLKGSVYDDILVGDGGDNILVGRNGADRLKGNDGQDTLDGGYGNDVLISENDGNVLIGGAGSDVFDLSRVEDLSDIATDIIKDFQRGLDTIKLSKAHMGDDNKVTAIETTMNGVEGLALTTNVGDSTVNFVFLEGLSDLSRSDFDGDHIPSIDVV